MILDRIKEYIDYKGMTIAAFERSVGMSNASFGKSLKNKGAIGTDKLENILLQYDDLSPEWLLTGNGDMLKSNRIAENTPKQEDASYSSDHKHKSTKQSVDKQMIPAENPQEGIPLLPISAMAGALRGEVSVLEYESERYVVPAFKGANFLIPVKGNSMIPTYQSGDIVACQRTPMSSVFFQWNKPYVLDTAQGAIIKRIRPGKDDEHVLIVSDNPEYQPFELHKSEIYAVALVIGIIRLE